MISKRYIVEAIGTFALAFAVLGASQALPFAVPIVAGLTLALFVYTIGQISGSHINPAVTLGLLSVKKISNQEAVRYIIAQVIGAVCAIALARVFMISSTASASPFEAKEFLAEALGAFFFTFGIASVVYGNAKEQMSGIVIGWSLLFGILIASFTGSLGVLNPAVALALNVTSIIYTIAPIVGAVAGFQVYKYVAGK